MFPSSHFECCDEALHSSFHVFLDKTCLKTDENWQGSGKADGGGLIGAVLQSLVFVPVLSVAEKNGQSFEALSASADIKEPWTRFDGSLGKLLRLNTVYEEKKDVCDKCF